MSRWKKRPLIKLNITGKYIQCLVDTGAEIPVWCSSEAAFIKRFPNAELCANKIKISGFGGDGTYHKVYKIPEFRVASTASGGYYTIHNMYCAISTNADIGYLMILSASMFYMMDYFVSNTQNRFEVLYSRDDYYMVLDVADKSLSMFTQDNASLKSLFSKAEG